MPSKKNDNPLALSPLTRDFTPTSLQHLASSSQPLTTRKRQIIEIGGERALVMEIECILAIIADRMIGDVHLHCQQGFVRTAEAIWELKDRPGRSRQLQDMIDQFAEYQLQMLARQNFGLLEAAGEVISHEAHKDVYPPPEPEPRPRPDFLKRVKYVFAPPDQY